MPRPGWLYGRAGRRRVIALSTGLAAAVALVAGCVALELPSGAVRPVGAVRAKMDLPGVGGIGRVGGSTVGARVGSSARVGLRQARPAPPWAETLLQALPPYSSQAMVVRAATAASTTNQVTLWSRFGTTWDQVGSAMPGRNGERGWSAHRVSGDLRTPIGVYSITATGGRLPNPGTREPYEYNPRYFYADGSFLGHSAVGVFNYVIAIDFNRVPGTPVSSQVEPGGPTPGGGIWVHVSNGVATEGCVTLSPAGVVAILRWLDPAEHPMIAMGPLV
jgi:L,D-peptidoglycan transpeptidase YkuD (ErfK/YbiS/YcfS/YnhG family)